MILVIENNLSTVFFCAVLETEDQLSNILVDFIFCLLVSNQDLICEGKKNAFISDVILFPTDVYLLMKNYWLLDILNWRRKKKCLPNITYCTTFQLKITVSLTFTYILYLLNNGKINFWGCSLKKMLDTFDRNPEVTEVNGLQVKDLDFGSCCNFSQKYVFLKWKKAMNIYKIHL